MARPLPRRRPGVRRARGFTLIEALMALVLAAVVVATAIGTLGAASRNQRDQRHAWLAFSIAQSLMEQLAAIDRGSSRLTDSQDDTIPDAQLGTSADAQCTSGVDQTLSVDMKVDDFGSADSTGNYTLCWKITDGFPTGALKTIRVVVGYPTQGGTDHVLLQLIR